MTKYTRSGFRMELKYSPDQERDEAGRFGSGGGERGQAPGSPDGSQGATFQRAAERSFSRMPKSELTRLEKDHAAKLQKAKEESRHFGLMGDSIRQQTADDEVSYHHTMIRAINTVKDKATQVAKYGMRPRHTFGDNDIA